MNNTNKDNRTSIWKFIIPSLSGILLFMIPIKYNDSWTLAVKVLADLQCTPADLYAHRNRIGNC